MIKNLDNDYDDYKGGDVDIFLDNKDPRRRNDLIYNEAIKGARFSHLEICMKASITERLEQINSQEKLDNMAETAARGEKIEVLNISSMLLMSKSKSSSTTSMIEMKRRKRRQKKFVIIDGEDDGLTCEVPKSGSVKCHVKSLKL